MEHDLCALLLDPTQWLGTRLWDDTAALYLLEPRGFAANGAHLEPAINEAALRQRLVEWAKVAAGNSSGLWNWTKVQ